MTAPRQSPSAVLLFLLKLVFAAWGAFCSVLQHMEDPERVGNGWQKTLALKKELLKSERGFVNLLFLFESLQ